MVLMAWLFALAHLVLLALEEHDHEQPRVPAEAHKVVSKTLPRKGQHWDVAGARHAAQVVLRLLQLSQA